MRSFKFSSRLISIGMKYGGDPLSLDSLALLHGKRVLCGF